MPSKVPFVLVNAYQATPYTYMIAISDAISILTFNPFFSQLDINQIGCDRNYRITISVTLVLLKRAMFTDNDDFFQDFDIK